MFFKSMFTKQVNNQCGTQHLHFRRLQIYFIITVCDFTNQNLVLNIFRLDYSPAWMSRTIFSWTQLLIFTLRHPCEGNVCDNHVRTGSLKKCHEFVGHVRRAMSSVSQLQIVELSNCQIVKLSNCQIVKFCLLVHHSNIMWSMKAENTIVISKILPR